MNNNRILLGVIGAHLQGLSVTLVHQGSYIGSLVPSSSYMSCKCLDQ